MASPRATLLVSCDDRMGIVARLSTLLYENACNIITSDQHTDDQDGHFFWRIHFESQQLELAEIRRRLKAGVPALFGDLEVQWQFFEAERRDRIVILVSKLAHCMMDLLSRYRAGELEAEVAGVVSNHQDLEPLAAAFNVPFTFVPVSKESKAQAEERLLNHLDSVRCDTMILARYMQVLSGDFLRTWAKPIVNIHHSFLPAFVGSQPYKQAHDRGVKLIGATAHYVTEELDAGPIIAQATIPVSHRDTVRDLARKGKDLEVAVLARAVHAHLRKSVIVHRNRTIVFE